MGSKCGQTRQGKLVGDRTLVPGVNGISRLSAGTEKIKRILNLKVWEFNNGYKFFEMSPIKRWDLFLHFLNLGYIMTHDSSDQQKVGEVILC